MHFAWPFVGALVGSKAKKDALLQSWRTGGPVFDSLCRVLDAVFRAARGYYRARRGTGEKTQDPASFYRIRNRHKDFARYWASARNSQRGALRRALRRLDKALRKQVES